ncbi:ABC transporter G family member 1 [Penicillium subrubescens]|uniref:ABC transporter G family member 1 n=1 Tax=Penicillium subrubescens TaxID=1316194 RepID=A0A1Q5UEY2_9EURO|nr:ABC transporter G family member 1 [Penicillium subrubescens]
MAPLSILTEAAGIVNAGEMLAIMGPSGSGKTTLLNALAHRVAAAGAITTGDISANGQKLTLQLVRDLSGYVEQGDALIGSLTEAFRRVDDLINSFGLGSQANTIVGTPIKKGLSGGQKKRLGVSSRLVTNPKIIFLDEPTSGLDSALSLEVCSCIKSSGRRNNQFDKLCLLSGGKTCYFGSVAEAAAYFGRIGHPIPAETNSAEFFLDLIKTDLDKNGEIKQRTEHVCEM